MNMNTFYCITACQHFYIYSETETSIER